ncbi:MAG: hypothetical protein PHY82_07020 [Lentisphaeria bacterium]|nr:hypothetical protein [Lentisphaeria bacterium]
MSSKIIKIQRQIEQIKTQLMANGPMRPGTLGVQYRDPKKKAGPFHQLSYTYQMKSRTEYVRPAFLPKIEVEIENFKRFKMLTQKWIDLALTLSRLEVEEAKKSLKE